MSLIRLWIWICSASAAIYGSDDRREVSQNSDWRALAAAVAVQVGNVFIVDNLDGIVSLTGVKTLERSGVCPTERFAHQPSVGMCTGFLIAPRLLLTAGHCNSNVGINNLGDEYCRAFSWMFDYNSAQPGLERVPRRRVYQCVRVIHAENIENYPFDVARFGALRDFAILELDRDVEGVEPLKLAEREPVPGQRVFAIGHPWGLPAKHSGVSLIASTAYTEIFTTPLDSLGGNSGSPVFNEELEVLGVLTAGHQFDDYDTPEGCVRFNRCDESGRECARHSEHFQLNEVQTLRSIRPYLPSPRMSRFARLGTKSRISMRGQ